jgi:hypothetical protein
MTSVYRVECTIQPALGDTGANIFHVTNGGADDAAVPGMLTAIKAFYTAIASFYLNTTLITIGASVRDIGVFPNRIVAATPLTQSGTTAGEALPANAALVTTWRTALAGRSFRGRTYLGPSQETMNNGGIPNGATVATIQTAAGNLITAIDAVAGLSFGVFSLRRTLPPFSLTPFAATQPITSAVVRSKWNTQRRRLA